jgi:hypothetical protein
LGGGVLRQNQTTQQTNFKFSHLNETVIDATEIKGLCGLKHCIKDIIFLEFYVFYRASRYNICK